MSVFDTFSKRKKKKELSEKIDVYTYDEIPTPFRIQIIHIWAEAIGPYYDYGGYEFERKMENNFAWTYIYKVLCKELGLMSLGSKHLNPQEQCIDFIQSANTDNALDIIELSWKFIDIEIRNMDEYQRKMRGVQQTPDDAISELNQRFFEHGLGYQYQGEKIIRVDSQYVHEEVVKAALTLIHEVGSF